MSRFRLAARETACIDSAARRGLVVAGVWCGALMLPPPPPALAAQTQIPPVLNPGSPPVLSPETARAWVHPSDGVDPSDPDQALSYINEPSLKFRTLNAAIDAVHEYLTVNYDATENPEQQGVVYALPGVYSSTSNGEVLPIVMRDRVHVQGVGARRCVVRGGSRTGLPSTNRDVLWPTQANWNSIAAGQQIQPIEVLVEYRASTPDQAGPGHPSGEAPWGAGSSFFYGDTPEVLDGFTLQGGDVQVLLRDPSTGVDYFPAARVSNCVFDLRDGIVLPESSVALTGPYIGLMMVRHATFQPFGASSLVGYTDGRTLIAHNTFIFARWTGAASNDGFSSFSRAQTVGVMDVSHPSCGLTAADADDRFRGIGSPCLVGNLFRTRPQSGSPRPYAMLGIADDDTRVFDAFTPGGAWKQTNAFDPARVGATNGFFHSIPVTSSQLHAGSVFPWPHRNCQTTSIGSGCGTLTGGCAAAPSPQSPAVHIWDGQNGVDPGFVGEYLATTVGALADYVDWRVLPGSPLRNGSFAHPVQGPRGFLTQPHAGDNQWNYATALPEELHLFHWDGEHWGNPRVLDGAPDIGFDEESLVIQAGNWSNDSNSHHQPGFMHPGLNSGGATRYFILPENAGGVQVSAASRTLRLHADEVDPPAPSTGDGWIQPPGSQSPPTNLATLPAGYRTKYIAFASTPWAEFDLNPNVHPLQFWQPLGGVNLQTLAFMRLSSTDDECAGASCEHTYFNLQALVVETSTSQALLRSNMIGEYR